MVGPNGVAEAIVANLGEYMKMVKWSFKKSEISDSRIKEIQEKLNVIFPKDFVECVLENNGGQPTPECFDFKGHKEAVFNALVDLSFDGKGNLFEILQNLNGQLPDRIIPFANDPFGNFFCFDFRENGSPNIVFWNHEKSGNDAIESVGFGFSEILKQLRAA